MSNSDNLDRRRPLAINDYEGKAAKQESTCIALVDRPSMGSGHDQFDSLIDLTQKSGSYFLALVQVPVKCGFQFGSRRAVKLYLLSHESAALQLADDGRQSKAPSVPPLIQDPATAEQFLPATLSRHLHPLRLPAYPAAIQPIRRDRLQTASWLFAEDPVLP
jgi:hypothetical protein